MTTDTAVPPRVRMTTKARALLRQMQAVHGALIVHLSGGCCEGSAPMCLRAADFRVGARDVLLGSFDGCPVYVAEAHYAYIAYSQLTIDVIDSDSDSFSLEAAEGVRFTAHTRLFTDAEAAALDAAPPAPTGPDAFRPTIASPQARTSTMKALVYHGPGQKALEEHPRPTLVSPTDAIVRITRTTICGTDLHILKGDVPTCTPGRVLGHEGVGVIEEVGAGVTAFKAGDAVIVSCISSCGRCEYCRRGMYSHCVDGGWILGNTIDGTQAEYVRVPFADTSLYPIPQGADEEALVMLSDILPTGFECGVLNGKVQPGASVAIVGAGPIGLAALLTAQFYAPARIIMIDFDANRLATAQRFGATDIVNAGAGNLVEAVMQLTDGRGVDTAIEAVGVPASFLTCEDIVAAGGTIANVGVHGSKADLHLERLWDRNIAITTRLVDTVTTPMLLKTVQSRKLDPQQLITHRFTLDAIMDAYETFAHASDNQALKVIIEATPEA